MDETRWSEMTEAYKQPFVEKSQKETAKMFFCRRPKQCKTISFLHFKAWICGNKLKHSQSPCKKNYSTKSQ